MGLHFLVSIIFCQAQRIDRLSEIINVIKKAVKLDHFQKLNLKLKGVNWFPDQGCSQSLDSLR